MLDTMDCSHPRSLANILLHLSFPLFLCLPLLHIHTKHTHDTCTVTHTLTVSHICFLDRMGRAQLKMESRLLSRYMASLEHRHPLTNADSHAHTNTHTQM